MSELHQLLSQGSLRFNLHVKKCPTSRSHPEKTKVILRSKLIRCAQNCHKHRFFLSKICSSRDRKFTFQKYGASYSFCPYHNQKMRLHQGGSPIFNNDRRIETPAFVLKYQTISDSGNIYQQRFKDVLARATNETLYTQDQKGKILEERKYSTTGKYPQFEKQVEELKEILIHKDERNSQK